MEEKKLLIDIREKPSTGKWFILSFQHVFAMFGSTVLVPMLTGLPINTALLCSGIGTFIYILCTKARCPIYLAVPSLTFPQLLRHWEPASVILIFRRKPILRRLRQGL